MDSRTVSHRLSRSRWVALLIGAGILWAWAVFLRGQLDELQSYHWRIDALPLVLGVLWGAIYFGGLALSWALLLRSIGGAETASTSLLLAGRAWLLSMITRYVPGNIWHVLSRVAFASQLQVSATRVLASATIEQILTIMGALALFGITLPFWGVLPESRSWLLLLLLPIGLLALHPRVLGTVLKWAADRLQRPELAWNYAYAQLLTLLLAFVGANLCAGLSLYTLLWGLTTVSPGQLPFVVGASALAWVVGYLSFFTPSGLGVREASLTALLAVVYPLPAAIIGSLLFRVVITIGELLAAIVAWLAGRRLIR